MKILSYFLFCVCVIGCGDYGDDEEEIRGVFPGDTSGLENQSDQQTPKDGVGADIAECIPDFHGELVSGALNSEGSEHKRIDINWKAIVYYYTLNLRLNDSIYINVVLEEAALAMSDKTGTQIADEDFLLVELDRLLEPGTWQGKLVKNLTRNISFEDD